jgi:alanine racemase
MPAGATGIVTVDLAQLRANYRSLAKIVAPAECAAVVKADAYGLGADRVVPELGAAGCKTFFVATLDEARQVRALVPSAVIYVLDGLLHGTAGAFATIGARPVLSGAAEVMEWAAFCRAAGQRLAAALHVDSGLNRLGLSEVEVETLADDGTTLRSFSLSLIMSHLACADEPTHPKNQEQLTAFERLLSLLPVAPASLSASDGLMLGAPYHFNLVRPGYALYGGQASAGRATPVGPVVTVQARVLQVRDVLPGQTIGYSATFTAIRPSRIAILAAGYADGFARSASGANGTPGGSVEIGGHLAPVVGRVSMDLITVDVTGIDPPPQRGDWATLIGPQLTLEEVGRRAGTIGYEVLTRLGRRFERRYIDSES